MLDRPGGTCRLQVVNDREYLHPTAMEAAGIAATDHHITTRPNDSVGSVAAAPDRHVGVSAFAGGLAVAH
jgi:pyrimidine deaminase RibD-like protein